MASKFDTNVRDLVLERILVAAQESLPLGLQREAEVSIYEQTLGGLVMQLRSYVLAHQLYREGPVEVRLSVRTPKTAWDHVKVEWIPTFTRIFKLKVEWEDHVRRETIALKSMHAFPESNMVYPRDLGDPIRIQMLERDRLDG